MGPNLGQKALKKLLVIEEKFSIQNKMFVITLSVLLLFFFKFRAPPSWQPSQPSSDKVWKQSETEKIQSESDNEKWGQKDLKVNENKNVNVKT